jgi:hypothetical protein
MGTLKSIQQIVDEAKKTGTNPRTLLINPLDIDELDEEAVDDLKQNPEDEPESGEEED